MVDKNKLIELCDQIKVKLQELNKTYYVLNIVKRDKDFTDIYDNIIDELDKKWSDNCLDCETRVVSYDCGGYNRSLQLYGILIRNNELLFYIVEVEQDYNGDEEVGYDKVTLDEMLDERQWWLAGGNPEVPFRLDEVLEYYLADLSE